MSTKITKLLPLSLLLLAGCAILQPHKKEMDEASRQIAAAELKLKAARDAGAAAYAAADLRRSEGDLEAARTNLARKSYALALTMAKSAESYAGEAVRKSEEAKRKEAAKPKAKRK